MCLKQKAIYFFTSLIFLSLIFSLNVSGKAHLTNVVYQKKIRPGNDFQIELFFEYDYIFEYLDYVIVSYVITNEEENHSGSEEFYITEEQPSNLKLTIPLETVEGDIIKFRVFYSWISIMGLISSDYSDYYTITVLKSLPILEIVLYAVAGLVVLLGITYAIIKLGNKLIY